MRKKLKFDKKQAYAFADKVMNKVNVLPIDETVIRSPLYPAQMFAPIALRNSLESQLLAA